MTLLDRIATEIAATGPMRFDRFMEVALYDPAEGFFGSGALRSHRDGDFLTSPEVSPLFGETLAGFVAAERDRIGAIDAVIDCGAGSGTLLAGMLAALPDVAAYAVEVSPAATEAIRSRLPGVMVVPSLTDLPRPERAVIIANELLDNLPAAVALRTASGWDEEAVAIGGTRLIRVAVPARSEVSDWADRFASDLPSGSRVEVQLAAGEWLRSALAAFDSGAVVVIDYGDTGDGLRSRRAEGTMRTYRAHHFGPDPLLEPGTTDITMDVDFAALTAVARESGAAEELTSQGEFLSRWGLRDRLSQLRHDELEEARHGTTMQRLMLRNRVTEGETLLHPRGLGDFRVLMARI